MMKPMLTKHRMPIVFLLMFCMLAVRGQNSYQDTVVDCSHKSETPQIAIFPNPATDEITVLGMQSLFKIWIYDSLGRKRLIGIRSEGDKLPFDVSFLLPGIYYYHALTVKNLEFRGIIVIIR